jgi:tetratricopeptide (TPR) repeat protein
MGRYLNLESLAVALGLLVVSLAGLTLGAHLGLVKSVGLSVLVTLLLFFPLATALQEYLLEWYAESGRIDRALDLALSIRDAAPNQSFRNRAAVDVALIQLLRQDYEHALQNLESVKMAMLTRAEARAVVEGHLAYCLAHKNQQLERAEELARSAAKSVPSEPIFGYFVGLVLYRLGRLPEAEEQIAQSIKQNPDPKLPFPGERAYHLALVLKAQGKDVAAARDQAVAAGGAYAELARSV